VSTSSKLILYILFEDLNIILWICPRGKYCLCFFCGGIFRVLKQIFGI